MLSASEAAPLTQRATLDDAEAAIGIVMGALGHRMDAGRIATVAMILAASDWTPAELNEAAKVLATDPKLRDSLRYGGTITPADFEDVRRGEETDDGERTITTIRGYALRVKRERLMDYQEAMGLWTAAGCPGVFGNALGARFDGAMFEPVVVEGEGRPRWRLRA